MIDNFFGNAQKRTHIINDALDLINKGYVIAIIGTAKVPIVPNFIKYEKAPQKSFLLVLKVSHNACDSIERLHQILNLRKDEVITAISIIADGQVIAIDVDLLAGIQHLHLHSMKTLLSGCAVGFSAKRKMPHIYFKLEGDILLTLSKCCINKGGAIYYYIGKDKNNEECNKAVMLIKYGTFHIQTYLYDLSGELKNILCEGTLFPRGFVGKLPHRDNLKSIKQLDFIKFCQLLQKHGKVVQRGVSSSKQFKFNIWDKIKIKKLSKYNNSIEKQIAYHAAKYNLSHNLILMMQLAGYYITGDLFVRPGKDIRDGISGKVSSTATTFSTNDPYMLPWLTYSAFSFKCAIEGISLLELMNRIKDLNLSLLNKVSNKILVNNTMNPLILDFNFDIQRVYDSSIPITKAIFRLLKCESTLSDLNRIMLSLALTSILHSKKILFSNKHAINSRFFTNCNIILYGKSGDSKSGILATIKKILGNKIRKLNSLQCGVKQFLGTFCKQFSSQKRELMDLYIQNTDIYEDTDVQLRKLNKDGTVSLLNRKYKALAPLVFVADLCSDSLKNIMFYDTSTPLLISAGGVGYDSIYKTSFAGGQNFVSVGHCVSLICSAQTALFDKVFTMLKLLLGLNSRFLFILIGLNKLNKIKLSNLLFCINTLFAKITHRYIAVDGTETVQSKNKLIKPQYELAQKLYTPQIKTKLDCELYRYLLQKLNEYSHCFLLLMPTAKSKFKSLYDLFKSGKIDSLYLNSIDRTIVRLINRDGAISIKKVYNNHKITKLLAIEYILLFLDKNNMLFQKITYAGKISKYTILKGEKQ